MGGYFLAANTLQDTLFGLIHAFVLPSLLTEGEKPDFSVFARCIVHYFHNALMLDDFCARDHLPDFSTIDGVRHFVALFHLALFLNALDERTYQLTGNVSDRDEDSLLLCQQRYNLNAIPMLERHQICYIRGLAMDLVYWFFAHYKLVDPVSDADKLDGVKDFLLPHTAWLAQQIIRYKRVAMRRGYNGEGTTEEVAQQIQRAISHIPGMKMAYKARVDTEHQSRCRSDSEDSENTPEELCDLHDDITDALTVMPREPPDDARQTIEDFLAEGQNAADKHFFKGLGCQFVLGNVLTLPSFNICLLKHLLQISMIRMSHRVWTVLPPNVRRTTMGSA